MKKSPVLIFALVLLCSTSFAQKKYVGWSTGYHTTWGGQSIANMYFKAYTHICWFDGGIHGPSTTSEGLDFTSTCHKNNTKAIVCIGGAGAGGDFTNATTNVNRAAYISSLVTMMQAQGFDGIDMDWEDGINTAQYTALHTELRAALDKITPRPLLTVATAQYLSSYTAPLYQLFDQMNVMSYWVLVGGVATHTIPTMKWMWIIPATSAQSASIPSTTATAASWYGKSRAHARSARTPTLIM
jgi:hypothetical protein